MTGSNRAHMTRLLPGLGLVLLGVLVACAGEWQRVQAVRTLDAAGGPITPVDGATNLIGEVEGLVRVSGVPQVERPARDRQFGVVVSTPRLQRIVEMQQWRELDDGQGGVSYVRGWYDHAIDSDRFHQPARHQNPAFPFSGRVFHGGGVSLAGLLLGPELVQAMPDGAPVVPQLATMPPNLVASFRLADNKLWTSTHPGSPRLGDLRISWQQVPLQELSIIARLEHRVLRPSPLLPAPGFVLMVGDTPLNVMLPLHPRWPAATWLWRLLGLALALAGGLYCWRAQPGWLLGPLPAVPLALLAVAVPAALMWLGTRWMSVLAWLALAVVVAAAALVWRHLQQAKSGD